MGSRRFFWLLLVVASFLAAGVSLLTTGLGLDRYLSPLLAWPLAFAVQIGLFGLAWLIVGSRGRFQGLVVGLYLLAMPFSVVFSYVMLQSELTKQTRPAASRRHLVDALRSDAEMVGGQLDRASANARGQHTRLSAWLALEGSTGWTSSSCEAETDCVLDGVCQRLRDHVGAWEAAHGQPYPDGPGKALIYGLLEAELVASTERLERLESASLAWRTSPALDPAQIDNADRLRRWDQALAELPRSEISSASCTAFVAPSRPALDDHSDDRALDDERPLYAFEELLEIGSGRQPLSREGFPTLFAFFLATFIDLFVLAVALGGGMIENEGRSESGPESDLDRCLAASSIDEEPQGFVGAVLDGLEVDPLGRARLVPADARQRRFAQLLVSCRAARRVDEGRSYELQDWVAPSLLRHLGSE